MARLGPLDALRLEPGDVVRLDGEAWRIDRLELAEEAQATLSRVTDRAVGEVRPVWGGDDAGQPVGAPFLTVMELPALPGQEDDSRPLVAVSAEPWRAMWVWAGGDTETLRLRAMALTPARIGVLAQSASPGVIGRWDRVSEILVDMEGSAPSSLSPGAVLAGGNAAAIQTAAGWEIVQFRRATLVGANRWRLTELLRGQQGTEAEMAAGGQVGGLVVLLDENLIRAKAAPGEYGLPMLWSAGPRGGPAGGAGVTRLEHSLTGVHSRPFRPAHLKIASEPGVRRIRWIPRTRTGGDVWEGEPAASDPMKFRIRVRDGAEIVRIFEVEGGEVVYAEAELAADFPDGPGEEAWIDVAQADGRLGWGRDATIRLVG